MGAPDYVVSMFIYIDDSTIGSGNRLVYWVGSDGVKSLVYDNSGQYNRHTLKNKMFSVTRVLDIEGRDLEFVAGDRLSYKLRPDASWIDAGPLTVSGRRLIDPSFNSIKRHGVNAPLNVPDSSTGEGSAEIWNGFEF